MWLGLGHWPYRVLFERGPVELGEGSACGAGAMGPIRHDAHRWRLRRLLSLAALKTETTSQVKRLAKSAGLRSM